MNHVGEQAASTSQEEGEPSLVPFGFQVATGFFGFFALLVIYFGSRYSEGWDYVFAPLIFCALPVLCLFLIVPRCTRGVALGALLYFAILVAAEKVGYRDFTNAPRWVAGLLDAF